MLEAVLFDLDGTLLPTPFETLMDEYLQRLGCFLGGYGEPRWIVREVLRATEIMIRDDSGVTTNLQTFAAAFFASTGLDPGMWDEFASFYRNEFPKLGVRAEKDPAAKLIVEQTAAAGLRIVLATNPLFPEIAVEERLRWAGLKADAFDMVTTAENMHYCKPNPKYYLEIAAAIAVDPRFCLMVGDDPVQDGAAACAGMDVLLLGDDLNLLDAAALIWEKAV